MSAQLTEHRLAEARRGGRREAESVDLRLRRMEAREREDRLVRLVAERSDLSTVPTHSGLLECTRIERLERELGEVSAYQKAIIHSKGWRLAQLARRLLGRRAW
jgi:hypothetical protein